MYAFTPQQVQNLQRGTRGVLVFGIVTSIIANVLNSLTRPEASTYPEWKLASSAALAALAPLVLFACTELVTRIPMHSRALGVIRLIVTFAIGGFAAWVSYWHMVRVAVMLGEHSGAQYLYPLIIDGMMVVATISLIELGRLARTVDAIVSTTAQRAAEAEQAAVEAAMQRESRKVSPEELAARKRARYDEKDQAGKAAFTRDYRAEQARKAARAAARANRTPQPPNPATLDIDAVEEYVNNEPVSPAVVVR